MAALDKARGGTMLVCLTHDRWLVHRQTSPDGIRAIERVGLA